MELIGGCMHGKEHFLSKISQQLLSGTSKAAGAPAALALEDGAVFYGTACAAAGEAFGEICFNTSLEGYLEVATDPSYAGQIITMTYPQIGNYGVNPEDAQSAAPEDLPVVEMDLNRPFAFMITGVDGLPLVLGTVTTLK